MMKRLSYKRVPMTIILSKTAREQRQWNQGEFSEALRILSLFQGTASLTLSFLALAQYGCSLSDNKSIRICLLTIWMERNSLAVRAVQDAQPSGMGGRPCDPPPALVILLPRPG